MTKIELAALLAVGVTQQQIAEAVGGIAKFQAMERVFNDCGELRMEETTIERMHAVIYGHDLEAIAVE